MFQRYVASVSYGCCKVDWDVAHVAMVVHVCCKPLSPIFYLFFYTYVMHVSSVSSIFFSMLQELYLDISKVDRDVKLVVHVYGVAN